MATIDVTGSLKDLKSWLYHVVSQILRCHNMADMQIMSNKTNYSNGVTGTESFPPTLVHVPPACKRQRLKVTLEVRELFIDVFPAWQRRSRVKCQSTSTVSIARNHRASI